MRALNRTCLLGTVIAAVLMQACGTARPNAPGGTTTTSVPQAAAPTPADPNPPPPPPPPSPPPPPPPSPPPPPTTATAPVGKATHANSASVRVFYATDRNRTATTTPDRVYGANRSVVSYGTCEVSIPRDHRMGELEAPTLWRLEVREDPEKHVVLLSVDIEPKYKFFNNLAAIVRASPASAAFLFVHGYNVSFSDAARRTAQISYDLGFQGAPVFYSWPSQGATPAYTVDEQNVEWAQANLKEFLGDFFGRSSASSVYLIAHSMGNRALTRAIGSLLAEDPSVRTRLKEVIL